MTQPFRTHLFLLCPPVPAVLSSSLFHSMDRNHSPVLVLPSWRPSSLTCRCFTPSTIWAPNIITVECGGYLLSCTPLTIQQWAWCVSISSGELLWGQFLEVVGHGEMTEGGVDTDNMEMGVRRPQCSCFGGWSRIDPQEEEVQGGDQDQEQWRHQAVAWGGRGHPYKSAGHITGQSQILISS